MGSALPHVLPTETRCHLAFPNLSHPLFSIPPSLQGLTALMHAADQGHTEIASDLIGWGCNVNAENSVGIFLVKQISIYFPQKPRMK